MDEQTSQKTDKPTTLSENVNKPTTTAGVLNTSKLESRRSGEEKKVRWLQKVFIGLVVLVIGFGGGWLGARTAGTDEEAQANIQRIVLNDQGDLISKIAEEVGQSVVSVNVTSRSASSFFWSGGEQQSAGTGIIISEKGLIVTNRHVVPSETTNVSVVLSDGTEFDDVRVVGRTNDNDSLDIAFLQIEDLKGRTLKAAKIGDSSDMKVGDSVIAIGNALGQFQNTVTTGILSGYGRSVFASSGGFGGENLDDLFQTDAAINQGNSGGPLVNINGEVIGINTAVANAAENIGFSIPIDNIKGLIKSVETTGKLQRPYMGVVYVPVNEDLVEEFDLKVTNGVFIPPSEEYGRDTVMPDAPADKAGIREGDVIIRVDDREINSDTSLASVLGQYMPGDKVRVIADRDGKSMTFTVTLGTMPDGN